MRRREQKQIAAALKRWTGLRAKKERIEAERDQSITPIRARFEQRCAPFHEKAQQKLTPIEQQMKEVEDEITSLMMSCISGDGKVELTQVDVATAVAEVITRRERELDPRVFFNSVPPSQRNNAFWSCLKTLIGKADKFLGADRVNGLAHARLSHSVSIRMKEGE